MIAQFLLKDDLALVVGIEVEVEGVDDAGTSVVDDDAARNCAVGLSVRVWSDAFKPWWVLSEIVVGTEVDIFLVAIVKNIEILQGQW